MLYRVKLKNSDDFVLLDEKGYDYLTSDPYWARLDLINNLRRHSSGCAVFQKTWRKATGGHKTETVYLHKLIAERFLSHQRSDENRLVGAKNGNKLDCRCDNLLYRSRSTASRKRKSSSKVGYTGVYKEKNRYRAVISYQRKSIHIGMYATAEEAALAYNQKSRELFGNQGKINVIGMPKRSENNGKEG